MAIVIPLAVLILVTAAVMYKKHMDRTGEAEIGKAPLDGRRSSGYNFAIDKVASRTLQGPLPTTPNRISPAGSAVITPAGQRTMALYDVEDTPHMAGHRRVSGIAVRASVV
jgi:hypothetical protein